jgi:transcriptional regulator with GAF, ATPase, and Fis domain
VPDESDHRRDGSPGGDATIDRTVPAAAAIAPGTTASARFSLVVIEGPNKGLSFDIDVARQGPVLVGQSSACTVQLSDRQASRRHAAFDLADRQLRVSDLGSTNGTLVNGVSIVEALLHGGERVRIGQTTLRVDRAPTPSIVVVSPSARFGRLVGSSVEMRRLYPLFERLAAGTLPVVIEGETGTGKELLAESLHELGARAPGPFVVFDCTAVAPTLVESELFGHERGAFTGAVGTRRGVFEQAHGGTLLIDEIGDLPLALQPKLLRVLERSEVRRVGGERSLQVDVRVLCATRRNLDREVHAGRFRDDLFHRLAVARVELPPLRRRRGDIAVLAQAFCQQMNASADALPEAMLRSWEDYGWPGNVRELRNAVMRRLQLGDLARLEGSSQNVASPPSGPASTGEGALERIVAAGHPFPEARRRVVEEFEQRFIERVLAEHGGNVTRAAEASGVARRQLQRVKGRTGK